MPKRAIRAVSIKVGDLISSSTSIYEVQRPLDTGSYRMVMQCRKIHTNETVALKMIKSPVICHSFEEEASTLRSLKELYSERFNIVRLNDSFYSKGYFCLEFEKLDIGLSKFMERCPGQHLHLKQIRPILQQLATSLAFLKSAEIVHADLKPQNIMMVDHINQPLRVKLIDFGLALNNPAEWVGEEIQSLHYRSPEILARQPFSGAIDVWSLGCIAAELLLGQQLFQGSDEHDMMKNIQNIVGDPYCFWPKRWIESRFMSRGKLVLHDDEHGAEQHDLASFIDLLMKMLTMCQSKRITPEQVLQHPFITMAHFGPPFHNSQYVKSSKDVMSVCQDQSSPAGGDGPRVILPSTLNICSTQTVRCGRRNIKTQEEKKKTRYWSRDKWTNRLTHSDVLSTDVKKVKTQEKRRRVRYWTRDKWTNRLRKLT